MYTVDINADEPIMLIDKHIGFDEIDGMGIDGSEFQKELLYLDGLGKKRIQVWINSPGGVVVEGFNIYNAILRTKTKVDTVCIGIAASISAVIFQAGRNRIICDYGILMYHNPFGGENSDGTEAMRNAIVKMISSRSGMNDEKVAEMMNRETFIDSCEALQLKLADEIDASEDFNKRRISPVTNSVKGYWKQSSLILNNIFKKPNMSLKLITNKLKLVEAANEESIVEAITAIQNKAKASDDKAEQLQKKLDEMEDKMKKDQAAYDALKGELDKAKDAMKASEDKAKLEEEKNKEAKAKDLVKNAVLIGKIKNDATLIAQWQKQAKVDFDGTKAMIDSIPASKTAVNIVKDAVKIAGEETAEAGETSVAGGVAMDMQRIKNKFAGK